MLILPCSSVISGAYKWTKDNKTITAQIKGVASDTIHTRNLTIKSMTQQLVGVYQCLLNNTELSTFDVKLVGRLFYYTFRIISTFIFVHVFCVGAQYSICISDPYACPKTFTYGSNSHFTLNATIIFIGNCCNETLSDPVWTVITNPGDSGQQIGNYRVFDPPGINICTETGFDFITNIARVRIDGANTTFQIMHLLYTDVDGEHVQQRSLIFNFYYAKGEEYTGNMNSASYYTLKSNIHIPI